MVLKNSQELAIRICHYYEDAAHRDRKKTYQYFTSQGIAKMTICRILQRYDARGTAIYKKHEGRTATVLTSKVVNQVDQAYKRDPNLSVRKLAQKLNISPRSVHRAKVDKLKLQTFKAISTPKYVKDQAERAKRNCRKIVEKRLSKEPQKILVIDDETYCPIDPDDINGPKYYTCKHKSDVSVKAKTKPKKKFVKQYLVWQCMDETGAVSKPYVTTATMTNKNYLKSCLKRILIPFINGRDVLFWPDMASCHYHRNVTDFLGAKNIDFVQKENNAPSVPQARPIEKFWALCKAEYRKRRKPAKNLRSFRTIWSNISKKVAKKSGKALMRGVRKKLRQIGRKGVYAAYKGLN